MTDDLAEAKRPSRVVSIDYINDDSYPLKIVVVGTREPGKIPIIGWFATVGWCMAQWAILSAGMVPKYGLAS